TLTAMMAGWLLRNEHTEPGRFARAFEAGFDGMTRFYERTLAWCLRHRRTTLIATLATVAFTGLLAIGVPKGFFPVEDTGMIVGVSAAAPDISFPRMMDRQQALANVLLQDPDVATLASFIGADGTNVTTNSGRFSIQLKPRDDRKDDVRDIIRRLM